jgi:hypothetical protein
MPSQNLLRAGHWVMHIPVTSWRHQLTTAPPQAPQNYMVDSCISERADWSAYILTCHARRGEDASLPLWPLSCGKMQQRPRRQAKVPVLRTDRRAQKLDLPHTSL